MRPVKPAVVARPELPYMTRSERDALQAGRASGAITMFRTGRCRGKGCGAETIQNKDYCSKKCWEGAQEHGNEDGA